jgi:hypothetical protein
LAAAVGRLLPRLGWRLQLAAELLGRDDVARAPVHADLEVLRREAEERLALRVCGGCDC